jgi:hypothetical protein
LGEKSGERGTLASTQEAEAFTVRNVQVVKRAGNFANAESAQARQKLRNTKTRLKR